MTAKNACLTIDTISNGFKGALSTNSLRQYHQLNHKNKDKHVFKANDMQKPDDYDSPISEYSDTIHAVHTVRHNAHTTGPHLHRPERKVSSIKSCCPLQGWQLTGSEAVFRLSCKGPKKENSPSHPHRTEAEVVRLLYETTAFKKGFNF